MLKPERLIVLGTKEWEQGKVRVKDVSKRETTDQTVDELRQALSGLNV